ncbi:MAG: class I SAM-dependent methyltransferase [Alphaproteobacteria bacterium]|nr:class I SAM-dependent methyltransferase [Alphaproteobacteria bacterium]
MKALLKKNIPLPVLNAARDMRDSAELVMTPRHNFAHDCLRPANDMALDPILSDTSVNADWERDHGAISALFGNDDKFGGINPGDRRALYTLIATLKPTRVLEVGTHIGASTLYIACALKNSVPGGHVTTVDILNVNDPVNGSWKKVGLPQSPQDFAQQIGCRDQITFVAQPSQDYMAATDERFDFIFLDGDHTARTVYREMAAALKILRPGGVILLHDFYPNARPLFPDGNLITGPFRALQRIMRENTAIRAVPLGRLPWPTKQGSHMTSLALVTRAV